MLSVVDLGERSRLRRQGPGLLSWLCLGLAWLEHKMPHWVSQSAQRAPGSPLLNAVYTCEYHLLGCLLPATSSWKCFRDWMRASQYRKTCVSIICLTIIPFPAAASDCPASLYVTYRGRPSTPPYGSLISALEAHHFFSKNNFL